ncbi:hypothetical protein RB620_21555 [Paenibacillus sp. LHD-117]|uniref:hypothetical protein n=1 Tax=Paenibacillus sp. LHD-117 TaxID=3071412 RepID=UPI0027E1F086|nr:hypothetical protein [Paenibacillus sp. LHD-117]MDQ6422020.1 hypothetical protein [Paenibacillus sp. LHD-117]
MKRKKSKKPLKKRIRDIASMKELSETTIGMKNFKRAMPVLNPFLKVAGVDISKIQDALGQIDDLAKQTEELVGMPDRFNDLLSEHGWIMYKMMDFTIAKKAVVKAESGDIQGAEQELIDYYRVETVRRQLGVLHSITAFRPRVDLAKKALEDYEANRFHACVPVVLALTDGLVNDLHKDNKGLSAGSTELEAWDSIAAHTQGLGKLVKILRKGRYKTTTEQISLPYRNGILHGTDLGYDNITVAAKTWATLFAVGEWASKVERGEVNSPEEKPKETFQDLLIQIQENEQAKKEIQEWKPRESISTDTEAFTVGSPEYLLKEFLSCWFRKNYGGMTKILPSKIYTAKEAPARIREYYADKLLKSFEFVSIIDVALANTTIEVRMQLDEYGRTNEKLHKFIMINEDDQCNPVGRTKAASRWISYTWRVY